MNLKEAAYISSDVLVIGGGGAGLRAAIAAREAGASVLLVSKSAVGLGNNTAIAKAGLAAATGDKDKDDDPDAHVRDTLEGGRFINDVRLVRKATQRIVSEVSLLAGYGVPFEEEGGKIMIGRSAGHSYSRQFYGKERRGTSLTAPLKKYASGIGVDLMAGVVISRLIVRDGQFIAALGVDKEGRFLVFPAKAVVIATGGLGQIYLNTDNAAGMTGDGYAFAFQLGIPLRDMEFVQFYPAALEGKLILLYEVFVLNLGGILKNARGENVLVKYGLTDPLLMTRDRVARAFMREILNDNDVAGGIVMDLSPVSAENMERFHYLLPPAALKGKREFLVSPTTHFFMGGIATDEEAGTTINGIFACGEVSGGIHGANRIAGNALTEAFAMGGVAGENAALRSRERTVKQPEAAIVEAEKTRLESLFREGNGNLEELDTALRETNWYRCGVIRGHSGLEETVGRIREIGSMAKMVSVTDMRSLIQKLELDNMLLVSEIVSRAALKRTESRGAHFREDYPEESSDWQASILVSNRNGEIVLEKRPVAGVHDFA
jgi:succinate dehydrogenase/fumarate reductase flavoprotein subunit